jgi:nucleotide-binding universal stress UspA family protein
MVNDIPSNAQHRKTHRFLRNPSLMGACSMKILLATDGSESASHAATFLARLPHRERMKLTIASIVPTMAILSNSEVKEWQRHYVEIETRQANKFCEKIRQSFEGADADIETVVTSGHPGSEILAEAKRRDCDLIVLGAVGHSLLERMMVGSVSDFVATNASCSVLVVRPAVSMVANQTNSKGHQGLRVCIGYDNSDQSKFVFNDLESFLWGTDTHFDIVSGFRFPFSYVDLPVAIAPKEVDEPYNKNLKAITSFAQKVFPNVQPHLIEMHHTGHGLTEFAMKHECDLIALGDTGHGLLGRTILGSVSRYVLRHAPCSVWIARNPKHHPVYQAQAAQLKPSFA